VPNIATQSDKIAFIKSSVTVGATHDISILKLNTGDLSPGRPSLGAWVSYALGSANPDLPPYVVLYNGKSEPQRRLGQLELRLPAGGLPGHGLPSGRVADPVPGTSGTAHRRAAAHLARPAQAPEQRWARRATRTTPS
jgi:hypothetical protein